MNNSTSDKKGIKVNIENSLKNGTILSIVFADVENSRKYPQMVSCTSLIDSQFTFTGLLPIDLFGQQFTIDLKDVLGCGTSDVKSAEYEKAILEYLRKKR